MLIGIVGTKRRRASMCPFLLETVVILVAIAASAGAQSSRKPPAQGARSGSPQASSKPSLDSLVSRATAYWNLLERGRKQSALPYVAPDSRETFQDRQIPEFASPRVTMITLTAKPTEVSVTVQVKKPFPMFASPVDWLVTEPWVFQGGSWYVKIEKPSWPEPPLPPGQKAVLTAEELGKRTAAIKEALKFESATLEFGTVRRSGALPYVLSYQLAGKEAFNAVAETSSPNLIVHLENRKLSPGNGRIQIELLTQNYDGEVNESFTIVVSRQDADVKYEFKIHAFVYTPVSFDPMILKFQSGEREKEVVLRNNSKSELVIKAAYNVGFEVSPLPQTISPGAEGRFKVTAVTERKDKNYHAFLFLSFDHPVEDMSSVTIPLIFNCDEPDVKKH